MSFSKIQQFNLCQDLPLEAGDIKLPYPLKSMKSKACDRPAARPRRESVMKMRCTEGTTLGETISFRLYFPGQAAIEAEGEPEFTLFLMDFPMGDNPESAYIFTVPAFALLTERICDHEEANTVAEWLERWAIKLRSKFGPSDPSL